jgi:dienelactone hydrolase
MSKTADQKLSKGYEPFARGKFPVGVKTIQAQDNKRNCLFPCEIWYPASAEYVGQDLAAATQDTFTIGPNGTPRKQMAVRDAMAEPGTYPLLIFSHASAFTGRLMATFLCTHLSSHGYVTAAMDHSELVSPALARKEGETDEQRTTRIQGWIANRVPDICFLIDHLLKNEWDPEITIDESQIGIVGHSFGGWTVLAAPEADQRIRAVVALAPGGNSRPKPGIIPATLGFAWGRDVPTLYLAAEEDVMIPLEGICEIFERTPATKQMIVLRKSDHEHFMDQAGQEHEAVRSWTWKGDLAWIATAMKPFAELCTEEQSHLFVRGLTLSHMDAALKQIKEAKQFLAADLKAEFAKRGVDAYVHTGK